ncbi:hypothetical protein [Aurantiacibacter hainanensis]|uniref:hypothetical protein n=1 Tax=Aurantiacibacter hainanensis TaxID=3076114 RepID=UPI0030C6E86B
MKFYAPLLLLPALALAACGEEPAPEATAAPVAAPEPTPSAPAPDEALFSELYAATCPEAEAVNESICKRAMGAETASCEFSLGDDEYMRNDATLQLDETGEAWIIADAETVCTQ